MNNTTICKELVVNDNLQGRAYQNDGKLPLETVCSALGVSKEDFHYILGYTYADGCIDYNRTTLRIRWKSKDEDLIVWLKETLKLDGKISVHEDKYFSLQKTDNEFVGYFMSYGIIPNKTYVNIFPIVDKNFYRYFALGYFDGDGCVSIRRDQNNSPFLQTQFVNKLKENLQSFSGELKNTLGLIPNIYPHEECFRLQYAHLGSLALYWYMYDNKTFFLKRKKDKFEEWLQQHGQSNYARRKCEICNNIYSVLHDKSHVCYQCKIKMKTQSHLISNNELR